MASYEIVSQHTIYFCNKAHCLGNCLTLSALHHFPFIKKDKNPNHYLMSVNWQIHLIVLFRCTDSWQWLGGNVSSALLLNMPEARLPCIVQSISAMCWFCVCSIPPFLSCPHNKPKALGHAVTGALGQFLHAPTWASGLYGHIEHIPPWTA